MKEKHKEWVVCGRIIGQATGWDQGDTFVLCVYGFKTAGSVLPDADSIWFNFEDGIIEIYDEQTGEAKQKWDLVEVLSTLEKKAA